MTNQPEVPLRDTSMMRSLSDRVFIVPHTDGYPPEINLYFGPNRNVVYLPFSPEAGLVLASKILAASREHLEWLKLNTSGDEQTQTEDPQKPSK